MQIDAKITILLKISLLICHGVVLLLAIPPLIICSVLYFFNAVYPIKIIRVFASLYWQLEFLFFLLHNRIEIKGLNKLNEKENYIICSNHVCAMDYNIIHYIAHQKSSLHAVKYILKSSIFYIPIFGIGMFFNGFCFLSRNFAKDEITIKKFIKLFKENSLKLWLVLFPEGTRFTREKKLESDKFCQSKNLKKFRNVLYPRPRGFNLVTSSLQGYVKDIVVVSVLYEGRVSNLFEMFCSSPNLKTVYVKIDLLENKENVSVLEVFEKIDKNIEDMKVLCLEVFLKIRELHGSIFKKLSNKKK